VNPLPMSWVLDAAQTHLTAARNSKNAGFHLRELLEITQFAIARMESEELNGSEEWKVAPV